MSGFLKSVTASSFVRSSMALMSGTVLSQGILFLVAPLLSRIFSVADFGNLANYNAWVSFLALLASLRYEHAIIVAKDRAATARAVALTAVLCVVSTVVYAFGAALFYYLAPSNKYLLALDGVVALIPPGILCIALSSVFIQLTVRTGRFRRLATVMVLQAVLTVTIQISLGLLHIDNGLVIGTIAGAVFTGIVLAWLLLRDGELTGVLSVVSPRALKSTAQEFVAFPRYTLTADALNVLVQQFTPVFVLALFNPAAAGLYAFAIRIARIPLIVISTAVGNVVRKEGAEHLSRRGNLRGLYLPIVRWLFLLGTVPFLAMLFLGRQIFIVVFGAQWAEAGRIVQILSPGLLLEFIALPLSVLFLLTHNQRYTFWLQVIGFVSLTGALLVGRFYVNGFMATCALVSAVMAVVNSASIVLAGRVSKMPSAAPIPTEPAVRNAV
jgi:O-antigen/teichoic acid export membrane protein